MASPRKKKMAKYMIEDLLAIAEKQIIRLNPNLDKESILEKWFRNMQMLRRKFC